MKPFDTKTPTVSPGASEQEVRAKLDAGEPVVFPDGDAGQRVVRAEWITKLDVPIRIANAVIRGHWKEGYAVFKSLVSIIDSDFEGEVVLASAKFEGALILRRCRFHDHVNLSQLDIAYDLRLLDATFFSSFLMRDAHIGQVLAAAGAKFHGPTSFGRVQVDKAAFFTPRRRGDALEPTCFYGPVDFIDARFAVTAEFDGAYFAKNADFSRVDVGAEAFFRPPTQATDADTDAFIKVPEEKRVPVIFAGDVIFRDAHFHTAAIFEYAAFHAAADFRRMKVGADALFMSAGFEKGIQFSGATVGADFDLRFSDLGPAAEMARMTVSGALAIAGAKAGRIDLRRSQIGTLLVSEDPGASDMVKTKSIHCGSLSFDRFHGDWRRFLPLIEPFSRDPYDALERHLRSAGDENHARDVYFERRKRQGQDLRKRATLRDFPRAFLLDPFERFVSRYGVRSFGLFFATLFLLALGMLVFTRPGALEPKAPNVKKTPSTEEAVVYSVALVIPLVQLPPIERWRPSANAIPLPGPYTTITFETFSAIYRLAGFLFVPLAVAVVTGLLYRRDRT